MSSSSARELARVAVTRVREREAFAHEALDALLARSRLDVRDASFASRLTLGTVACRGVLDEAVLRHVCDPARLEPRVLDALAVSAYELLFARTPPRAAVSEGVELVRSVRPEAAGLANAVLRRLAEEAPEFPWGHPDHDVAALARAYGHPAWMAALFVEEFGRPVAEMMMAANNEPAPLFLAHLPFTVGFEELMAELNAEGAQPVPGPLDTCITAQVPRQAVRSAALRDGHALVVDAAAQFAAHAVPLSDGCHIVELGAGRGTKTLLMAAHAAREGIDARFTAVDVHPFKLEALKRTAQKVGAPEVDLVVADATDPCAAGLPLPGTVDSVLVDAPCSGLGTLRRHPDARWRMIPDKIETLAALATLLLKTAASLVKPGGFVVYSTCTITRRENQRVIEGFLGSHAGRGFRTDDLRGLVTGAWDRFVDSEGRFRSVPEIGGPDGHFVARLLRAP